MEEEENKPFNDVIDHFNKIEGNTSEVVKTKLKKLPKLIRYFGYFIFAVLCTSLLLVLILSILN